MKEYRFTLTNNLPAEAQAEEILVELIDKKINYYKIQNMKSLISNECCDEQCLANITLLSDARAEIKKMLNDSSTPLNSLKVNTTISIEVAQCR